MQFEFQVFKEAINSSNADLQNKVIQCLTPLEDKIIAITEKIKMLVITSYGFN